MYPHPSTCWRRLREWYEADVLNDIWRPFLSELDHNGILGWDEVFVDASFFPAKEGAREVGKTKRGKGSKCLVLVDGKGVPLGSYTDSASPAEITLLVPHRKNHRNVNRQDDRLWDRYRRRITVERTFGGSRPIGGLL